MAATVFPLWEASGGGGGAEADDPTLLVGRYASSRLFPSAAPNGTFVVSGTGLSSAGEVAAAVGLSLATDDLPAGARLSSMRRVGPEVAIPGRSSVRMRAVVRDQSVPPLARGLRFAQPPGIVEDPTRRPDGGTAPPIAARPREELVSEAKGTLITGAVSEVRQRVAALRPAPPPPPPRTLTDTLVRWLTGA